MQNDTDSVIYFLERKCSAGAAIEWYYQYQSLYLRLMAENQMAECAVSENGEQRSSKTQRSGNCLNVAAEKMTENGFDEASLTGKHEANTNSRDSSSYSCPRCGNAYTRSHSLNRHIRFECGVEPQFECPICHKKSKHKHNLVLHMRTHQKS
ncbi:PREDICTED: zinc finger E-box-binding homeobox protein zag-1-like [Eufriesea mexicana]|uniref:zinc finger E-box-binding homeobox protein zag-1-like n=1 Tax=Eufriesea mexicana TaxID=516756 RepID=UPI00083C4CBD|nr:PREDICTED: zinc finger E-box-binding homeobox protein zag-1-like [Eufriesea mexicana]